jgi:hypothetical protein
MKQHVLLALCVIALATCSDAPDAISVQVCPAVLAAEADATAAGWDTLMFAGNQRAVAGKYLVRREPLFTEWNIVALRPAGQSDGALAVAARLNAHAQRQLGAFTSNPRNLKRPLAVRIDGRWADVVPVLGPISELITLPGFTEQEAQTLQQCVDNR